MFWRHKGAAFPRLFFIFINHFLNLGSGLKKPRHHKAVSLGLWCSQRMGKETAFLITHQAQSREPQEREGVGRACKAISWETSAGHAELRSPTAGTGTGALPWRAKGQLGGHTNHSSAGNKDQPTALPLGSIKDLATSLLSAWLRKEANPSPRLQGGAEAEQQPVGTTPARWPGPLPCHCWINALQSWHWHPPAALCPSRGSGQIKQDTKLGGTGSTGTRHRDKAQPGQPAHGCCCCC